MPGIHSCIVLVRALVVPTMSTTTTGGILGLGCRGLRCCCYQEVGEPRVMCRGPLAAVIEESAGVEARSLAGCVERVVGWSM